MSVVALIPKDGVITARGPLVAKLMVTNTSDGEVVFPCEMIRLEVRDCFGALVGTSPPPEGHAAEHFVGLIRVPAGRSLTRFVVLSALYQFERPGNFNVSIRLPLEGSGGPINCATKVRVRPYDAARLRARCRELVGPVNDLGKSCRLPFGPDSFPLGTRLRAMYSIHDDTVLPYLSAIARDWEGTSEQWPSLMAIRRIRSERARALFDELAARDDRVGEVARMAAKQRLDPVDDWYVGDSWRPMISTVR